MVADAEDVPPITASPIPNCHWLLQFLTAEIYPSSLIQTFLSSSALFYWRSRPTLDESVWLARVTREFQREHPCPSTGRTSGANALSNAITREVRFAIALGSLNVPSATVSPALYPSPCRPRLF